MIAKPPALAPRKSSARQQVSQAILSLVVRVPASRESARAQIDGQAQARAQAIGRAASRQASLLASSLALPPGFLGWLTVLPELIAVWKLQAQMVSDIAGVYGKSASMGQEQMIYCLFKHVSAQLLRDVVVQVGERVLVQRASSAVVQSVVKNLGIKITQNMVGKGLSRFLPLVGAVGVGAYAYFDTRQVASTAIALFSSDMVIEEGRPT
jgi:EcsC protein family